MSDGAPTPFGDWDGVVFDLDGTLVELVVDWPTLERDLAESLRAVGLHTPGATSWELLEAARDAGVRDRAESVIAPVETAGAEQSVRLPLAGVVAEVRGPVAVCSLNCETACRTALRVHDLEDAVDAVVGRDTFAVWKPDPKPLVAAFHRIGVEPDAGVFIGDSERDRTTADRAGVEFLWVGDVIATLD